MNCEAATNLISSKIDGELPTSEARALEEHLAGCPGCRATMDVLGAQDADLQKAFAPRRAAAAAVADATISRIYRERTIPLRPRRFPFLNTVLSAAAGFAIALLIIQPWKSPRPTDTLPNGVPPAPSNAVAHLALATGTIEVLPEGQSEWQVMPTGAGIAPNSRVRTPDKVRCEIVMPDDSTIRLNSNSEVLVGSSRRFDLKQGQMWSRFSTASIPFTIAVAQASITSLGTEFDVQADAQQATLTVIEGSTRVIGKSGERVVKSGNRVRISGGDPGNTEVADVYTVTSWVNELLMMKGRDNPELRKRIDGLLASLGNEKMAYMLEPEIKALGDHCVLPLVRFVQSELSADNRSKRHQAARIASEMAQPWSIPEMIELLKDDDGEVRYYAARALQRLANTDQGVSPEQWRNQPVAQSRPAYDKWLTWWQRNKGRYPAGPMGPTPMPMPKMESKARS